MDKIKKESNSDGSTTSSQTASIFSEIVNSSPPSVKDVTGSTNVDTIACPHSSIDDEKGLQGSILERSSSFDAMLKYLESGHENFKENSHKFKSQEPAQSFEETWDYSLRTQSTSSQSSSKNKSTIWLTDIAFLRKLEEFNVFETCDHEVVKIPCPCENKTSFSICGKCHRVFCCNKCYKQAKSDKPKISSESDASTVNNCKDNSVPSISLRSIKQENAMKVERNWPNSHKVFNNQSDMGRQGNFQQQPPPNFNQMQPNMQMQIRPPPHRMMMPMPYNNKPQIRFPRDPHFINSNHRMQSMPSMPWDLGVGNGSLPRFYPPGMRPQINQRAIQGRFPGGMNFNQFLCPIVNSSSFHSPNSNNNSCRNLQENGQNAIALELKPPSIASSETSTFSQPSNKSQQNRPLKNPHSSLHMQLKEAAEFPQKESIASQIERSFKPSNSHVPPSSNRTTTLSQDTIQVQKFRGIGRGYQSPKTSPPIISTNPSPTVASNYENKSEVNFVDSTQESTKNAIFSSTSSVKEIQQKNSNLVKEEEEKTVIDLGTKVSEGKSQNEKASKSKSNIKKSESEENSKIEINGETFILFGIPMLVGYSYGDSVFDFFVWNGLGNKNNDKIADFLKAKVNKLSPLTNPVVGDYCVARYNNSDASEIDGWYRGQIVQVSQDTVRVYFIDYGNDDELGRDDIKTIPSELLKIQPSVIRISIGDFEPAVEPHELEPAFNNFIVDQWIRVTIFDNKAQHLPSIEIGVLRKYYAKIEIKYGERWIGMADILESDGFGAKIIFGNETAIKKNINPVDEYPALKINHEIPVEITHVNNLNDFYVIPKSRLSEFDFMMKRLQNSNPSSFKHFRIDKWTETNYICLAQRANGQWARVMIAEITPSFTAEAHFIDFGDTQEVKLVQLKRIPLDYLKIPKFAYRCSLPVFPSQGIWDAQDPDFKILDSLMESNLPIVIVVFALEDELHCHIVEVFLEEKVSGLTKSLIKNKKESCSLEYTVNLEIRKQLKQSSISTIADKLIPESPATATNQCPKPQIPVTPKEKVEEVVDEISVKKENDPLSTRTKMIITPPSPSLHDYMKNDFEITHFASYNCLFIKPVVPDTEMFLQDEIVECIDSGELFKEPPEINTLVIARYSNGNLHRAVVRKIIGSKMKAEFIDFGETLKISLKDVIPASKKLLQTPALAYKVKLINVEEDAGLIMSSDFSEMKKGLLKLKFKLELCSGHTEPYCVDLKPKDSPTNDTISKRILDKQVWEWERILNKYAVANDVELFKRSKYYETDDPKEEKLCTGILPPGIRMEGEVSRFTRDGDIHLVNIKHGSIQRDQKVLENQINRFVEKVKPIDFFPKLEEVALVYLADIPELRELNLYGIGKWNRCVREENYYRNVDFDEIYPVTFGLSGHLIVRKIGPEFLRFRTGVFMSTLKDYKPSEPFFEVMERELKPRSPIYFTVDHYDVEDCIHVITIENLRNE